MRLFLFNITSIRCPLYSRDMCDHPSNVTPSIIYKSSKEVHLLSDPLIAIRITRVSVCIDHPFVEN